MAIAMAIAKASAGANVGHIGDGGGSVAGADCVDLVAGHAANSGSGLAGSRCHAACYAYARA